MSLLNKFRKPNERNSFQEQVLEHLCDLLNTKRGYGAYQKDLGLDSYIYLGTDKKVDKQIMSDIATCLQKYEKRISQIEVEQTKSEYAFMRAFIIKCRIEKIPLAFRLSFNQQKNSFSVESEQ
jgi:predicted component of type VI protein secretion system